MTVKKKCYPFYFIVDLVGFDEPVFKKILCGIVSLALLAFQRRNLMGGNVSRPIYRRASAQGRCAERVATCHGRDEA